MLKKFLLIIVFFAKTFYVFCTTKSDSAITDLISKENFEILFPHHNPLYSYENFIAAAKSFPLFLNEGDITIRKKELAAFFANIAHETSGGWPQAPGGIYVWGLVYTEEQACKDGRCTIYNSGGYSNYVPVPGKSYQGRGALQISYAYNYGLAGKDLNLPLLQQPELVSTDGIIAFKTALWFWMRDQKPKPSCHNVICGNWQPNAEDIAKNRKPGFGMLINIINGGLECNTSDPIMQRRREERIGFYKWFSEFLQVKMNDNFDCSGMGIY
jgi:hypothetical protein